MRCTSFPAGSDRENVLMGGGIVETLTYRLKSKFEASTRYLISEGGLQLTRDFSSLHSALDTHILTDVYTECTDYCVYDYKQSQFTARTA